MSMPRCLTIAGSDSGGGAGIQADLKTFAALGCYGTSVLTALTAQNTLGVDAVHAVGADFVRQQLKSVLGDIGTDAIKLGMLHSTDTVIAVRDELDSLHANQATAATPIVLDPVCVSTSGHALLAKQAITALRDQLLPRVDVLTPNVPEAALLAGIDKGAIASVDDMLACAARLGDSGVDWVYLKGGHLEPALTNSAGQRVVVDVLWNSATRQASTQERPYIDSRNTHGTGCTLSAAIAAFLARGATVPEAVRQAADYVAAAIVAATPLGGGFGPVAHFHNVMPRSIALPSAHNPTPFTDYLIAQCGPKWEHFTRHAFPFALARGDVDRRSFLHFIVQDYHYLVHYARTNALAAYKSDTIEDMAASSVIVNTVANEVKMHLAFCERFGISKEQVLATQESIVNTAYNRFVLDSASKGDLLDLRVVTAPCLIGYGHAGAWLCSQPDGIVDRSEESNPFWRWISEYGGEGFQGAVRTGIELLERTVAERPIAGKRLEDVTRLFVRATELEIAFWDEAIAAAAAATTVDAAAVPAKS